MSLTNKGDQRMERFRTLTDSSLDRLSAYLRWTATVATGAMVWIGSNANEIPHPYRLCAIAALAFLLCSLVSALVINFASVKWWSEYQRTAQQELVLNRVKEAIEQSRSKNESITREVASILQKPTGDYLGMTENLRRWYRLAKSPDLLLFHSATLLIGVLLYLVAQVLYAYGADTAFSSPLSP